jgi:hypothetical protein
VAAAEAAHGRGVVVTTPYDPAARSLVELQATYRRWQQDDPWPDDPRRHFPPSATDMHRLIGTTWRNLHTASVIAKVVLVVDRWGHPHLCAAGAAAQRHTGGVTGIGSWIDGRYTIEHWVRVDAWEPAAMVAWYVLAVAAPRDGLMDAQRKASEIRANWHTTSCPSTNLRLAVQDAAQHRASLAAALRDLHAFADAHGLTVTRDMVNGIPFRRTRRTSLDDDSDVPDPPEQLTLF